MADELEFHIYLDQKYPTNGGYIECPVCHNHMRYHSIKDTHEWCEPFYRTPRYVVTETTFHLHNLHCDTCETHIDDMYVKANKNQIVMLHYEGSDQT